MIPKDSLPRVTIIIPYYKGESTIAEVIEATSEQEYPDDIYLLLGDDCKCDVNNLRLKEEYGVKIIRNEKNPGLASNLNNCIKKAKTDYIVTLHQDCKPVGKNWLTKLMSEFKDPNVVASISKTTLPKKIWEEWGFWKRAFSAYEVGSFYPSLDTKGTAFKKDVFERHGYFDAETFKTAGEDVDLFFKIKKKGKIARPNVEIVHLQGSHRSTFYKQIWREFQYGEGNGANIRRHKLRIFHSSCRLALEATSLLSIILAPFFYPQISALGIGIFLVMSNMTVLPYQLKLMDPDLRNITLPFVNFLARAVYVVGALKGFITGKQRISW